jgi:hypothetical protein
MKYDNDCGHETTQSYYTDIGRLCGDCFDQYEPEETEDEDS